MCSPQTTVAGERSARVPLTDPMTADQACAPLAPGAGARRSSSMRLSSIACGRSTTQRSQVAAQIPWATPAQRRQGGRDVKPGAALDRAERGRAQANSSTRVKRTAVGDLESGRRRDAVQRRRSGWRGRAGAYWPRLASCVLRGGSARSRSMRSTSAWKRLRSAPASCWLGGCLSRRGLICAPLRRTS